MAHEIHTKETDEGQTVVGQERPPVEEPPPLVSGARESSQEATSAGVPAAAPPAPPGRRLTARERQLPPVWRWALGIGLAVLGGLAWFVFGFLLGDLADLLVAVPAVMCLVAGWLLRSWWGLVAAAGVYVAVSALGWVQFVSGVGFSRFALGVVLLAVVMSTIGTIIGRYRARGRQLPPAERWALGISLAVLGGLAWYVFWFGFLGSVAVVVAAVPAVMCLVTGWLLRSWWGLVAAAGVYVAISALMWVPFVSGFPLPVEFALYVVLPAVVMSIIGTAIGMYSARGRHLPPAGRWALGISLAVLGGLAWLVVIRGQNLFAESLAVVADSDYGWGIVGSTLIAAVPAVMCLVAGWLLRSWWGLVAAALVYVAVSALVWVLFVRPGPLPVELALYEFARYVVLLAVVMSAIGTAIGMYRARWKKTSTAR